MPNSSLEYIRNFYSLPFLRVGMRCTVDGKPGEIIGANSNAHLSVLFVGRGETIAMPCHPTWRTEFFDEAGMCIWRDPEMEVSA